MSSNHEKQILTVQGEQGDIHRAVELLSQLDLRLGYVHPERLGQLTELIEPVSTEGYYHLDQISRSDQWFGREHVIAFNKDVATEFDKKIPSQVFSALVAPAFRSGRGKQGNHTPISHDEITPVTGLIVSSRKSVNFPPLAHIFYGQGSPPETIKRVVQVGSMFTFYARLSRESQFADRLHALHNPDSSKRKFLDALMQRLSQQVGTELLEDGRRA